MPNTIDWPDLLARLAEPFPAEHVKWRAGSVSKDKRKAIALAYAEPRAYEDRLNALCPGNWHVDFQPWGDDRIICRLTIHHVTRSSTGESGDSHPTVAGTSAEAQAFKRACSKFGLGRYLYDLPTTWVAYDPTTKRLLETPRLRTQPQATAPHSQAQPGRSEQFEAQEPIGAARAAAMHAELTRLGLPRKHHYNFASEVLNITITSFAKLREAEAKAVWTKAIERSRQRPAAA